MYVGTGREEAGLSNILSVDKSGPLNFMFNRTINNDVIYILVIHTISCAVCTAGFV